jgi:hypothetical protein
MADYTVLVGINRGEQRWEPGDTVPVGTFSAEVEANFVEIGVLQAPPETADAAQDPGQSEPTKRKRKAATNAGQK